MNYITEINAFYHWLVGNPISANAQALWHRLMAYCNRFSWAEYFTVTNGRLTDDLSISKPELDRIRNILCQKGLIVYVKGSGNQCGSYKIISFASQNNANPETQTGCKPDANPMQTGPLNKLNETKQGVNKTKTNFTSTLEIKTGNPFLKMLAELQEEK